MPKIQFTIPDGTTLEFEVTAPSSTIGRAPENDFVVPDGSVSSRHGQINLKGEDIEIVDLGSTNGTYVGSERVQQADIKPGGAFRLGNVHGILAGEAAAAEPESAESPEAAEFAAAEEVSDEPLEESAPEPQESWSAPAASSGPVIAGVGASPCPTHMRKGFGPKAKRKDSSGTALMGLAAAAIVVCAAAVFFVLKMAA